MTETYRAVTRPVASGLVKIAVLRAISMKIAAGLSRSGKSVPIKRRRREINASAVLDESRVWAMGQTILVLRVAGRWRRQACR